MKALLLLGLLLSMPQAFAKDYSSLREIERAILRVSSHWPWNAASLNQAATFYQTQGLSAGISPTDPKFFEKSSNPCAYNDPATIALCTRLTNPAPATATASSTPAPAAESTPAPAPAADASPPPAVAESAPVPEAPVTDVPLPEAPREEAPASALIAETPPAALPEVVPVVPVSDPAPSPIVNIDDFNLPVAVVVTEPPLSEAPPVVSAPPRTTGQVPATVRSSGNPQASNRALDVSRRYNAEPYGLRRRIGGIQLLPDEPREPASVEEAVVAPLVAAPADTSTSEAPKTPASFGSAEEKDVEPLPVSNARSM